MFADDLCWLTGSLLLKPHLVQFMLDLKCVEEAKMVIVVILLFYWNIVKIYSIIFSYVNIVYIVYNAQYIVYQADTKDGESNSYYLYKHIRVWGGPLNLF